VAAAPKETLPRPRTPPRLPPPPPPGAERRELAPRVGWTQVAADERWEGHGLGRPLRHGVATVVVPVLDHDPTAALRSVEAAAARAVGAVIGLSAVEIVVVDDGSATDGVALAAEARAAVFRGGASAVSYTLLRMQANVGAGRARNAALRRAAGEHTCFLDADDAYRPEHLLMLAGALGDASLAWVRSGLAVIGEAAEGVLQEWRAAMENGAPTTLCARTSILQAVRGFPDGEEFVSDHEDLVLHHRLEIFRRLTGKRFVYGKAGYRPVESVEYRSRGAPAPGNHLFRQMEKFRHPMSAQAAFDPWHADGQRAAQIQKELASSEVKMREVLKQVEALEAKTRASVL